jgi:Bacterial regulatory proteins, luxR family
MTLVVVGLANTQSAAELELSEMTVKVHRGQVMRKMRARSLPELVRMADRLGMPATTSAGDLYQSRSANRPASPEFVLRSG